MQLRVLGAVELLDASGNVVALGGPKPRRILAVLVARLGETVSVDTLAEAVWNDDMPTSTVATVRTYVSRLRRVLGNTLVSRGAGYALDAAPEAVDLARFEALYRDGMRADGADAVTLLDAALALWHGPAFGEHADVESIAPEARRLEELRRRAHEAAHGGTPAGRSHRRSGGSGREPGHRRAALGGRLGPPHRGARGPGAHR